jgi:hypothetical protein
METGKGIVNASSIQKYRLRRAQSVVLRLVVRLDVGLNRNVLDDVGGYYRQFIKRRVVGIGHSDEHV